MLWQGKHINLLSCTVLKVGQSLCELSNIWFHENSSRNHVAGYIITKNSLTAQKSEE